MALPGIITVLKDRFYTISRTDQPAGPKVVAIARRTTADGTSDGSVNVPSYDPYLAINEKNVIAAFGDGSECHRAYIELVAGGATQIYLIAMDSTVQLSDLTDTSAENIFDKAFDAAETIQPDIIVPWGRGSDPSEWGTSSTPGTPPPFGFYADNSASQTDSLAKRVADKCQTITNRSYPVFAVMGVKPYTAASIQNMTAAQIASHLALPGLIDNTTMDGSADLNGEYLSVVATENIPLGYQTAWGYSNGACLYAGFISTLESWRATTGKVLFNVHGMRYNPTRVQQESLTDAGVVPVALNFNRVPTWIDGTTFGQPSSDYVRLSTLRIVFDAVLLVRNVAQGFIGEAASIEHRNAFDTAVSAALMSMKQLGALLDANSNITYIARENKAIVDLILQPAFELRVIEIQVSVQF